jgi:uncharacterized protein YqjF (DUF2071 family)
MWNISNTEHRPWPVPSRPWIMTQTWHNILFAHWPCPPELLRPLLPEELSLDTFDGQAWVGIVTFRMTGIRLRGFPLIPIIERFPEINVRTYVSLNNRPGVCFLSLDADNPVATAIAKPWFRLAYRNARIDFEMDGDMIKFKSVRTERGAPEAGFAATYRPVSDAHTFAVGTLENWLTERYCYYAPDRYGDLYCGEVHHAQWPLQQAEVNIAANSMALSHGIHLPDSEPLLHYAHYVKALIWNARRTTRATQSELRGQVVGARGLKFCVELWGLCRMSEK